MDVIDLYLYGGFALGWLLGRWHPSRRPWVGQATFGSVVALLVFLGASFRSIAPAQLADALPEAVVYATLLLGATAAVFLAVRHLDRRDPVGAPDTPPASRGRVPTTAVLLAALLSGYGIGQAVLLPTGTLIPAALALLLGLVGYGIELHLATVRGAWLPLVSAVGGALVGAVVFGWLVRVPFDASVATALGFGWYSLTGPLVAARFGATLGLFAFLTNFLREGLTMLLSPYLGGRLRGEGLIALGGATAMDTTLYFVVRFGDRRAGALSVASGLTLTIAASLVVPLVLAL